MPLSQIFNMANMLLNAIRVNKILAKISKFTVFANIIDECMYSGKTIWTQIRVQHGSALFDQEGSKTFQQTTKADNFCCD